MFELKAVQHLPNVVTIVPFPHHAHTQGIQNGGGVIHGAFHQLARFETECTIAHTHQSQLAASAGRRADLQQSHTRTKLVADLARSSRAINDKDHQNTKDGPRLAVVQEQGTVTGRAIVHHHATTRDGLTLRLGDPGITGKSVRQPTLQTAITKKNTALDTVNLLQDHLVVTRADLLPRLILFRN